MMNNSFRTILFLDFFAGNFFVAGSHFVEKNVLSYCVWNFVVGVEWTCNFKFFFTLVVVDARLVDRENSPYVFIADSKQVDRIPIHVALQGWLHGGMCVASTMDRIGLFCLVDSVEFAKSLFSLVSGIFPSCLVGNCS